MMSKRCWFRASLFFILLLGALLASGSPATAGDSTPRAYHDLTVTLHPDEYRIEATDRITLENPGSRIVLSLNPDAIIDSVSFSDAAPALPYSFDQGQLACTLPVSHRDRPVAITIRYAVSYPRIPPANPVSADDPTYGVTGTVSPRGVLLLADAGWIPELEIPETLASYRIEVLAPRGMEALTAGEREVRETTETGSRSIWRVDQPARGIALSAGRYKVRETTFGSIPVQAYFYPDSETLVSTYLDAAIGYLDLYTGLLGPYPFPKFAVVENFFPTGYGFASYTLLGSTVIRLPFIVETSLGHEVAHSWFGNGVFVDPGSGNWSEGLVTYIADHLYKERASEAEGREYRLQILRGYASLVPPEKDFPVSEFVGRTDPVTSAVGYGKTAMIFHMIRREVGDAAFWRGLRTIVTTKLFQQADWRDFFRAFGLNERPELGPFADEWLLRPGAPVLGIEGVKADREGTGWRVTGRITQREPVFHTVNIPVRVEAEAGEVVEVGVRGGANASFEMRTEHRPLRVRVDPDVHTFRRLDPSEIPVTVNTLRGSDNLAVVVAESLPADTREAALLLLAAMGREDAPVIEERAATPERLAGRDILLLGLPVRPGLLPKPPPEVVFKGLGTASAKASPLEAPLRGPDNNASDARANDPAQPGGQDIRSAAGHASATEGPSFEVNGVAYADAGDVLFMTFPAATGAVDPGFQEARTDGGKPGSTHPESGRAVPGGDIGSVASNSSASGTATGVPQHQNATMPDRHAVALFLPLSARAAEAVTRKIPHYGRQSLLVFSQGTNRVKSTWPATGLVLEIRY